MTSTIETLYTLINDRLSVSPRYQENLCAIAKAKLAVLDELEQLAGKEAAALLDVYSTLEAERTEQHDLALFEAALKLGMELGAITTKS